MVIDHIDNNGLNNQRNNLRFISHTINSHNKKLKSTNKYIGVNNTKLNKWTASIQINGKQFYIGTFDNEFQAAKEYDKICY